MNRLFGVVVTLAWLVAMTALVQRDVLPMWVAQETPHGGWPNGRYQIGIYNQNGLRLGSAWVTMTVAPTQATVQSVTCLEAEALGGLFSRNWRLLVDSDFTYGAQGRLEQFCFRIDGVGPPIRIEGERYGQDLACTLACGQTRTSVPLDGRLSDYLGESLRPFTHLADLRVGQRWRIRLLDPLALVQGGSMEFRTQLATVTAREVIMHRGRPVECFRIEFEGGVAWAEPGGRILRQEVDVPFLGRWVLLDEPFDGRARKAALASRRGGGVHTDSTVAHKHDTEAPDGD